MDRASEPEGEEQAATTVAPDERALYERSPAPHLLLTRTGVIVELNAAAAELLGQHRQQLVGTPLLSVTAVTTTQRALLLAHLDACIQGQLTAPLELDLAPRGEAPRLVQLLGRGIAGRLEGERLCLLTIVPPNPRRSPDQRLALQLAVARAACGTLDPGEVVEGTAAALVPELADLCAVDLVAGSELVRRSVVRHVDPERGERFACTEERWGVLPNLSFATLHAMQTGQPQVIPAVSPAYLETAAVDPEHFTELMGLVLRSWVVVPLRTLEAGVMGALRLARAGVRPPFDDEDVQLAVCAAELAAQGLANARSHDQARVDGGARERQAAALARELEEAVRSLARARAALAPASAAGLEIGRAAERLRVVIRELQGASRPARVP